MRKRRNLRLSWLTSALIFSLLLCPSARGQEMVQRVREKVLEFFQAFEQQAFDTYVKGRISNFDRVYKNYHYLVTDGKINEVQGFVQGAPDDEARRAYDLMRYFLTDQTIRAASAPEIDGANNYLADTKIVVGGEEISLRNVVNRMADEPDRSKRRQWSFAFKEFHENANVYLAQSVHLSNRRAADLGYKNYQSFLTEYKNLNLAEAQQTARRFLAATDTLYRDLLVEQIAAVYGDELDQREIRFYDIPRMAKMSRFDERLPARRAFQTVGKFFGNLGLSLEDDRAGSISLETASENHARDGVAGYLTSPPRSMKVGMKPTSGFLTYAGLLREIGILLCRARAGGQFFENHFFGDPTLAFGCGHLFENLMENGDWLAGFTKLEGEELQAVRRAHAFLRLAQAREFCGRILFLPQIYEGVKQPEEAYEAVFEPISMWRHTEVDRVMYMQTDDAFDCIAQLQAMILAAGLENTMERKYGEKWYEQKAAGQFLSTFWADGQKSPAATYAEKAGATGFDPDILVQSVQASVGR